MAALDRQHPLGAEYATWCANNKLPDMPPDEEELHYAPDSTDDAYKIDEITKQLQ